MHTEQPEIPDGERPKITSKSDVTLFEAHDIQTGAFCRSMFTYFDSDEYVWIGENVHLQKKII